MAITIAIALVWLINGLYCKILGAVPRHELIVSRILGNTHAELLTKLIGVGEVTLALWILSGRYQRHCMIVQISLIAGMNLIEFFAAPDLLLFGKWNSLLALLLICVIYWNEKSPLRSRSVF